VIVTQQDLVAQIAGGSFQQFGRDTAFELDGSGSNDPDEMGGNFYYTWSCVATSTSADCSALNITANTSTLAVPDLTLPIGEYTFSLLVQKNSRNDTATVDVEILAGAPPVISIDSLSKAKYNTDASFLGLVSFFFFVGVALFFFKVVYVFRNCV
jgi:hypothetical protein